MMTSSFRVQTAVSGICLTWSAPYLLPGCLSPTSLLFLMSCQGQGLPKSEGGTGAFELKYGWRRWGVLVAEIYTQQLFIIKLELVDFHDGLVSIQ